MTLFSLEFLLTKLACFTAAAGKSIPGSGEQVTWGSGFRLCCFASVAVLFGATVSELHSLATCFMSSWEFPVSKSRQCPVTAYCPLRETRIYLDELQHTSLVLWYHKRSSEWPSRSRALAWAGYNGGNLGCSVQTVTTSQLDWRAVVFVRIFSSHCLGQKKKCIIFLCLASWGEPLSAPNIPLYPPEKSHKNPNVLMKFRVNYC